MKRDDLMASTSVPPNDVSRLMTNEKGVDKEIQMGPHSPANCAGSRGWYVLVPQVQLGTQCLRSIGVTGVVPLSQGTVRVPLSQGTERTHFFPHLISIHPHTYTPGLEGSPISPFSGPPIFFVSRHYARMPGRMCVCACKLKSL
jgi:hypothetical protein